MLIAVACFVGIFSLFVGAYWLFILRPEGEADRALARRLSPKAKVAAVARLSLLRRMAPRSAVPGLEWTFVRFAGAVRPLERLLERSGLRFTAGQVVLGCTFLGALTWLVVTQLTHAPWIALGAALMVGSLPFVVVKQAAGRRLAKFEAQFPEAIDLIARALRAGHALTTGLGMVAEEVPDPIGTEFRLLHDRQNYGMPLADALRGFAERVPLLDARFFVTAVLTQREAGGNLSEVLDSLAALIRDRFRLKRQVRVLSAHGRITGWVLCGLPLALTAILFVIAPAHIGKLFTDPLGIRMVAVAVVLQVVGFVAMRRIVNIQI